VAAGVSPFLRANPSPKKKQLPLSLKGRKFLKTPPKKSSMKSPGQKRTPWAQSSRRHSLSTPGENWVSVEDQLTERCEFPIDSHSDIVNQIL
jgi:hypothetical protein